MRAADIDRTRLLVLALGLTGGAVVAEAVYSGRVVGRAQLPPAGWHREASPVPYHLTDLAGTLPIQPEDWSLDFGEVIFPLDPAAAVSPSALSGRVRLPEEGQIVLWASSPPPKQPVMQAPGRNEAEGGARGAPAGGRPPSASNFERDAEMLEWVPGFRWLPSTLSQLPSTPTERAVGLVLERLGVPSSEVVTVTAAGRSRLPCSDGLPAPGATPLEVSIVPAPDGVRVSVGGARVECPVVLGTRGPSVHPGMRRVAIGGLTVNGVESPAPGPGLRPLFWLVGALVGLLVAVAELWLGAWPLLVALTSAPLILALPLRFVDTRLWTETARLTWLPDGALSVLGPVGLVTGLKLAHHLGRALREQGGATWDRDRRDWPRSAPFAAGMPSVLAVAGAPAPLSQGSVILLGVGASIGAALVVPAVMRRLGSLCPERSATWIVGSGTLAACVLAQLSPLHPIAVPLAGGVGLSAALLVWANANAPRLAAYNFICLAALGLSLISLEHMVRYTEAGVAWSPRTHGDIGDIYGIIPTANEQFQLFESGRHTRYPDRGFPVPIPAADGRRRLVAMGGSSTGGAFQNDDLDEFYPARMAEALGPAWQVVNQGVGGWTTWHIRRYLEASIDALDPDVLTLYVGRNDALTPVPLPFAELYTAWRQVGANRSLSTFFQRFRLYMGLRYGLAALRPADRRVAVPVEDAELNLQAIRDLVVGRGGRLILASEGLSPDPGPLYTYNTMMSRVAAADPDHVQYLDLAGVLYDHRGGPVFLDDSHLTALGHGVVAERLVTAVKVAEP